MAATNNSGIDELGKAYEENIRPIIDIIDNLRRFGLQEYVDLPCVVVLGDQSSGKSSIIESISGIELPRGKGIVTRCPLELQLKRVINQAWIARLTYKDKHGIINTSEIHNPSNVDVAIRQAQNQMCTSIKGVSNELITLRIESPSKNAPDLTLIDLPGIARVAVKGQPENVCSQIRKILIQYIRKNNTVILCVVSANLDAAVNESISIAKQYDPDGIRTFGVITKPDMVTDESMKEDVLALLNNNKIHLEKGYNMVKCRAQKQLEEKMDLTTSLTLEKEFFDDDPFYSTAAPHQLGVPNLAQKITVELVNVIRNTLPSLTGKIRSELQESRDKLQKIPKGVPSEEQAKVIYLFQMIGDLNGQLKTCFNQGYSKYHESNLFSDWRRMFEIFKKAIDKKFKDSLENELEIRTLQDKIKDRRGEEISGFLNYDLFKDLVSKHVQTYSEDAFGIVKEMIKEEEIVINEIIVNHFCNLPDVQTKLKPIVHTTIQSYDEIIQERIQLVFREEILVFTMDTTFEAQMESIMKAKIESKNAKLNQQVNEIQNYGMQANDILENLSLKMQNRGVKNALKLREMISCYLEITTNRLGDIIPMAIRNCLHVDLIKSLQEKFIEFTTYPGVAKFISENPENQQNRLGLNKKVGHLSLALKELSKL